MGVSLFGLPDAQKEFASRNKPFLDHLPILHATCEKTLLPRVEGGGLQAGLIYFLNRLIAEEFNEVLLLSSNGYGKAAKRLLRGMYERLVASAYIEKEKGAAERFVGFGEIQRLKYANHKKRLFKVDILSQQEREDLESFVKEAKKGYVEVLCKEHGCTRDAPSWTLLSVPAMAESLGVGFEKWYVDCYFEPTQQLHNTTLALSSRLKLTGKGVVSFDAGPQPEDADRAAQLAHMLLVCTLDHHNNFFRLGRDEEIKQRYLDITACWGKPA